MRTELKEKLLDNGWFLSLFYKARKLSEEEKIPFQAKFMELGLNTYKESFPQMCIEWGIDNLNQIVEFDKYVRSL